MTNEEKELKEKMEEIERQTLKELNAPCDATLEDDEIKMIQEVNAVIAARKVLMTQTDKEPTQQEIANRTELELKKSTRNYEYSAQSD